MFLPAFVNNPESFEVSEQVVETIFRSINEHVSIPQNGTVNIAFLPNEEIQRLNREYRSIDKNTDVLSFHYFEDFSELSATEIAGEIILSESKITEQALEYGNTADAEFYKLLIHSILHLLGHDHETDEEYAEMRAEELKIEKIILEKIGIQIH